MESAEVWEVFLQAELESIKSGDVTVKEQPDSDSPADAKGTLKDPYVNLLVQKLRSDLKERESRIENLTAELNAWQLTSADGLVVALTIESLL